MPRGDSTNAEDEVLARIRTNLVYYQVNYAALACLLLLYIWSVFNSARQRSANGSKMGYSVAKPWFLIVVVGLGAAGEAFGNDDKGLGSESGTDRILSLGCLGQRGRNQRECCVETED